MRICRTFDPERLRRLPPDAAAARLERERGIGPYSIGIVWTEGLGRFDRGIVGDLGLLKICSAIEGRWVESEDTARMLGRYEEWAGLACVYLMAGASRGLVPLKLTRPEVRRERVKARYAPPKLSSWLKTAGASPSSAPGRSASHCSPACSARAGASRRRSSSPAAAQERIDELARALRRRDDALEQRTRSRGAAFIVIAVKPQDFEALLGEVGGLLTAEQTVLSVAAAIPTASDRAAPRGRRAGRARDAERARRPCTRASPGSARARTRTTSTSRWPRRCCTHVGRVVRVPEPYMDAVTAVSGSGPAYFALLAEAMIEAGILLGLSREVSTELVVQTMFGTAKLLRDEHMHPVELREMVTSPGGTTIRAIRELERAGVRAAFLNAIQAAMERSKELAEGD